MRLIFVFFVVLVLIGVFVWLPRSGEGVKKLPTTREENRREPFKPFRAGVQVEKPEETADVPRSKRHAAGEIEKDMLRRSEAKAKADALLEGQINHLLSLQDDQLMLYASGLDLPDNPVKALYPKYLEAKRNLVGLKVQGLGDVHPTVKAATGELDEMRTKLDEGVTRLRTDLQARLGRVDRGSGAD